MIGHGFNGPLALHIPGDPNHLSTARSFASSIARVVGMSEVHRHDIQLAMSELLTIAIKGGVPELHIVADNIEDVPVLRIETGSSALLIPAETSELLSVMMDQAVWSVSDPWLIRLVVTDES